MFSCTPTLAHFDGRITFKAEKKDVLLIYHNLHDGAYLFTTLIKSSVIIRPDICVINREVVIIMFYDNGQTSVCLSHVT